jgi:hypothetical protein
MGKSIIWIFILYLIGGCGNQRFTAQGETKHLIEINLGFIQQVRDICDDLYPDSSKDSAQCAIDNIGLLNLNLAGTIELACPTGDIPPELEDFCVDLGSN